MRILVSLLIGLIVGLLIGGRSGPEPTQRIERVEVTVPECKAQAIEANPHVVASLKSTQEMFMYCMKALYSCNDDKDQMMRQKGDLFEALGAARAEAGLWQSKYIQSPSDE